VDDVAAVDESGSNAPLDTATVEQLRRAMQGQDMSRLLTLMGLANERDIGGEEPYDPEMDQLVILLAARIDGQPAVGADIVQVVRGLDGLPVQLITQGLEALPLRA
jgi:hypothetical protein